MTLSQWVIVMLVIGVGYSFWHVRAAWGNWRGHIASGRNGLEHHVAIGDVRSAATQSALAVLALAVFAVPFITALRVDVRTFVTQLSTISFVTLFVVGMAFARLHAISAPHSNGRDDHHADSAPMREHGDKGEDGDGDRAA